VMADEVNMGPGRCWRLDREWPAHSAMNRCLGRRSRAAAQLRLWERREKNNFNEKFPLTFNRKLLTVNE
jgi:hypothetical protein